MTPARPRRIAVQVVTVLLLGATLVAAWWFVTVDDRAHDRALERWESQEPSSYSFEYRSCSGMCMGCELQVTVSAGEVTEVTGGRGCDDSRARDGLTIEDVFAIEEDVRSNAYGTVEVAYDSSWGYPASIEETCPSDTADCGAGYSVTDFDPEP